MSDYVSVLILSSTNKLPYGGDELTHTQACINITQVHHLSTLYLLEYTKGELSNYVKDRNS